MSFHRRNISDYVKDIPMRFSSSFSQLPPEKQLKSFLELSPAYVDRLSASDSVLKQFDYDFNVERIALQDAERERERVLREAEEKLKELELNKQLNETQVKKPIEDVINSDKPIQLTNAKTPTSIGETTPVTSNYDPTKYEVTSAGSSYPPFYYVNATSSNPTVSFNYPNSIASSAAEPSVAFSNPASISTQSIQPNLVTQPNTVTQSSSTSQHACLPQPNLQQTTLSQNSTVPTNLPNYYSSAANNLTRSQPMNQPMNVPQTTASLGQLTKNPHSDNGLTQSGLQPVTTPYNPAAPQHYSQSHHQLQTSLPNYNAYLNSPTNYSPTTTASIRGVYNNAAVSFHAYPPPNQMPHLNHNLSNNLSSSLPSNSPNNGRNNKLTSNNLGQPGSVAPAAQGAAYSPTTYTTTNYVPSTYTNGILLPQQSVPVASKEPQQADDKQQITTNNKQASDSSATSDRGSSPSNAASLPFARPNGKKIDVTDFENSSSPFDDALLRSIDDKEELNNIFQQFYNGAK